MTELNSAAGAFMKGRQAISTKAATVFANVNGQLIKMFDVNKFSAKLEKNKEDIQTLGTLWKRKKVTSIEGTGTLGWYLTSSELTDEAMELLRGGSDLFFEITLTIEDPTAGSGKQTLHFTDVNLDDIPFADFEADDDVMQNETDFTFEGVELVEPFDGLGL